MRAGRVVALVLGCILGVLGLLIMVGGIAAAIASAVATDADGFFRTDEVTLNTPTAAVVSDNLDLGGPIESSWVTDRGDFATVLLDVDPGTTGREVFAGIGPRADVEQYLGGVSREQLIDFRSSSDITFERRDGAASAAPPAEQPFWVAQLSTSQPGELTWEVESGDWAVVVMNADGSGGLDVGVVAGVKVDWLLPVAIVLIVVGAVMLAGGTLIAVFAVRGSRRDRLAMGAGHPGTMPPPPPPPAGPPPAGPPPAGPSPAGPSPAGPSPAP